MHMDKVTCLMLTFDRFDCFRQSFRCYCDQTYPEKELLIVSHGDKRYQTQVIDYISASGRTDVRTIFLSSRQPLGALRNLAVAEASTRLVCQWDDDDLSHPTRLSVQIAALRTAQADASYLLDHLHLFRDSNSISWCDWSRARRDFGHPGTLLGYTHSLPLYHPDMRLDEDSQLQQSLLAKGARIALLGGFGYLHVYVCHGNNVFKRHHHQMLTRCYGLERETLRAKARLIWDALNAYPIEPPVTIVGHNGDPAFTWRTGEHLLEDCEPEAIPAAKVYAISRNHRNAPSAALDHVNDAIVARCQEVGLAVTRTSDVDISLVNAA
jgi:glycosyltransferase involved in cell wall biosynthesis